MVTSRYVKGHPSGPGPSLHASRWIPTRVASPSLATEPHHRDRCYVADVPAQRRMPH